MTKHPLMLRLIVLGLLTLLLFVPLWMVRGTVDERAGYRAQAEADIATSWGGRQTLSGPMLVQTYHTVETVQVWDPNVEAYVEKQEQRRHRVVTFPEVLDVLGNVHVEQRYRGIYAVPVYRAELTLAGAMAVPAVPDEARELRQMLVLGIQDTRGLRAQPEVEWGNRSVPVDPGTATALRNGLHATLDDAPPGRQRFGIRLALGGSQGLSLAPVGGSTRIEASSNWPHPRFTGGYLPEARRIGPDGFEATWRTSRYAATVREGLEACVHGAACALDPLELVTLELTDPVNVYALNDRSTKYALLFVLVVFGVFFMYEALKKLRIHPVQYALVGLGQALFFLLLLSLSEHVAFGLAYLAGAALCIGLLAFYVSYVLKSARRAAGFAVLLCAIYGALYVMLLSEDYALLLGSMLLLAILAGAMYLTRNVDWYSVEAVEA